MNKNLIALLIVTALIAQTYQQNTTANTTNTTNTTTSTPAYNATLVAAQAQTCVAYKASDTCEADTANTCAWVSSVCAAKSSLDMACMLVTTEATCVPPCAWASSSCSLNEDSLNANVYQVAGALVMVALLAF